jgi:hypothetical protein
MRMCCVQVLSFHLSSMATMPWVHQEGTAALVRALTAVRGGNSSSVWAIMSLSWAVILLALGAVVAFHFHKLQYADSIVVKVRAGAGWGWLPGALVRRTQEKGV